MVKRRINLSFSKEGNEIKHIVATYKRKKWNLAELLEFMAKRINTLERKQCKPSAKCLFKGQEYIDDRYIKRDCPTDFY
jgi:hypothetical protein